MMVLVPVFIYKQHPYKIQMIGFTFIFLLKGLTSSHSPHICSPRRKIKLSLNFVFCKHTKLEIAVCCSFIPYMWWMLCSWQREHNLINVSFRKLHKVHWFSSSFLFRMIHSDLIGLLVGCMFCRRSPSSRGRVFVR